MKGLVLSGGKGTRLRPITHTRTKQLVPVANKPILHYCLENIIDAGITDIGVIVSPESEDYVKESLEKWKKFNNAEITYILQEEPLGLAHAVLTARDYLADDSFIMYLGDNLIKKDIKKIVKTFISSNSDALIMLKEVSNPKMFGVANIENDQIIKLEEKPDNPQSNLALVGIYLFNKNVHTAVENIKPSGRGELEITDAIQYLLENSYSVTYHILKGWWLDTGKKDDLLVANRIVLDEYTCDKILGTVCPKSKVEGRVEIGENSNVVNSVVRGPVVIGENCCIENAYIGPYTSISDCSEIKNSEIEYSVVMDNSKIHNMEGRIEESLIGTDVKLECLKCIPNTHKLMVGDHSNIIFNTR